MNIRAVFMVGTIFITTSRGLADPPRNIPGPGGPRAIGGFDSIIMLPGVRKQLKLTDDQIRKVDAIVYKHMRRGGEYSELIFNAPTREEKYRQATLWAQKI